MTPQQRIDSYCQQTGYPRNLFVGEDDRIVGTWIMGNNYAVKSGLYGGYPHGYLKRVAALFPDKSRILHLFSGCVDLDALPGKTCDINSERNPDYVDDAQTLVYVPVEQFDLVIADPPYSVEDCDHYGVSMVKRNRVMKTLGSRMQPGAHVVWLDQVLPMYRRDQFVLTATIGMLKSTNHRFRMITIFERRHEEEDLLK